MELVHIQQKIYRIRGGQVMLDFDLAEMFEIETCVSKQSVRRNAERFPKDFMFPLTKKEMQDLVSQSVMPDARKFGGANPFAFTEHGVAMLASVLRSERAVQMNIAIVRAFIAMRQWALSYKDLAEKLAALEQKYDKQFGDIYEALRYLMAKKEGTQKWEERQRIGFKKS